MERGPRRSSVVTEPREALKARTWASPRLAVPAEKNYSHHKLSARGYRRAKAAAA